MISQEELKAILNYQPETGIFTRNAKNYGHAIGSIAGTLRKDNYISIGVNKKLYLAHRLAWLYVYGYFPKDMIDHVNGVKNDNRILNLRIANRAENYRNVGIRKTNKSGYKGVCFCNSRKRWLAQAWFNGKRIFLGYFEDAYEASVAYKKYAISNHGEFYREK